MAFSWEEFQTAYNNAPTTVREVVDSERIPQTVEKIASQFGVGNTGFQVLVMILSRVVLGVYKDEKTLHGHLGDIVNPAQLNEITTTLFVAAKNLLATPPSVTNTTATIASDIAEAEAVLETLAPMRTMASDMHALQGDHEPIHQSSQDQVLNTQKQSAPTTAADSRWGSS